MPPGKVLVVKDNWEEYFGPDAGRSYVFAREVLGKRKHSEVEDTRKD